MSPCNDNFEEYMMLHVGPCRSSQRATAVEWTHGESIAITDQQIVVSEDRGIAFSNKTDGMDLHAALYGRMSVENTRPSYQDRRPTRLVTYSKS